MWFKTRARRANVGEPRYGGVKAGLMAGGIRVRRLVVVD